MASQNKITATDSKKKQETARKIAALVKNQSAIKTKSQLQISKSKSKIKSSAMKSTAGTPHLAQENQAIKRQKLEGGRTRQVTLFFSRLKVVSSFLLILTESNHLPL